jgi:inorganic pyrophosphatase
MTPAQEFFRWRPHPWHGLSPGPDAPGLVHVFVEITPFDLMKYEVDKVTGYTVIDRPQRTSSQPPALYGFIPRTYAGARVGARMSGTDGGDGDPLDVCVLSERPIERGEVLLRARPIGGLPMVDHGLADDKIISVLERDPVYGELRELDDLPDPIVQRLVHYFSTYKRLPGEPDSVSIGAPYGRVHAEAVIEAALEDYAEAFPDAGGDGPA